MKLKLVVLSMSVLGLVSCPVLAATKHKHHHHMKKTHHMVKHDYRQEGELNVQPAPVMAAVGPMIDTNQLTVDAMTQNLGRQVHGMPDWFQRIAVVGGVNFDAAWGQRANHFMGENTRRIALNDVYLNITALVNDWTKAFASLSYNNASPANATTGTFDGVGIPSSGYFPGVYSAAYSNNSLTVEQGYVTFGNFNCSPFFVQLGKQFQDFGRYQIHPMTRTLTQVMSESLQTSAKVGFLMPVFGTMSLHGAGYAFDNSLTRSSIGHTQTVYGASLGIDQFSDQLGYDLGVGYMSNMGGVNDVAYAISAYEGLTGSATSGTYNATVGAVNVYGDVNSGPFSFGARYTTAIQHFNPHTLSTQYMTPAASGARPWAVDATAGFGFNCWTKNQNVYVGYQATGNAVNLFVPKNRWLAGYGVDMWKNASLGIEYHHNTAYGSGNHVPALAAFPGNSSSTNEVHARAAVKFG